MRLTKLSSKQAAKYFLLIAAPAILVALSFPLPADTRSRTSAPPHAESIFEAELIKPIFLLDQFDLRVDGAGGSDESGYAVSNAGDVNGDGFDDLLIGAFFADNNGRSGSGSSYVVFGSTDTGVIDLAALSGQGFRIDGAVVNDWSGYSVGGAGDVNNDGLADLLIGAYKADNNGRGTSGSSYVVFGANSTDTVDLRSLGSRGYRIDGAVTGDESGESVAGAGDVNSDGRDDLLVGANRADNNNRAQSGSAYLLFGKSDTQPVDLAALGSGGFRMDGAAADDLASRAVAGAGDVNGDGRPDLLVAVRSADNNGRAESGSTYLVYGKSDTNSIDFAALGNYGFRMDGAGAGDNSGWSVAGAGNLNDDQFADLIVGARYSDYNGRLDAGAAYAIYGKPDTAPIDFAALGSRGFRMEGARVFDSTGAAVGGDLDLNLDGRDDLIVGAYEADFRGLVSSGSAYVIFGAARSAPIDLENIGTAGYRIDGAAAGDFTAYALSKGGDINNDGNDDLIVGARWADNNGRAASGSTYAIYGPYPGR